MKTSHRDVNCNTLAVNWSVFILPGDDWKYVQPSGWERLFPWDLVTTFWGDGGVETVYSRGRVTIGSEILGEPNERVAVTLFPYGRTWAWWESSHKVRRSTFTALLCCLPAGVLDVSPVGVRRPERRSASPHAEAVRCRQSLSQRLDAVAGRLRGRRQDGWEESSALFSPTASLSHVAALFTVNSTNPTRLSASFVPPACSDLRDCAWVHDW